MKKILNATIKVKHVLIALVLLVGMAIGFAINRPHFRPKRQMAKFEHRQVQQRNQFKGRRDFKNFRELSAVEKASIDSLKSLIKHGDWENNKIIFGQIRSIVKGD